MAEPKECGCHVRPLEPKAVPPDRATVTACLAVWGMGCPNCATRVRNALVGLQGVAATYVSLAPPIASVRYDPASVTESDLIAAVAGAAAGTSHEYWARILL
ncbi:MAG: hypothetical protein GTN78_24435 [Gemmatimonadales bacterium]|nr:hypothetical protein [Gemmatimonadales bacterium]NIN12075.1 hypothetical protein [Gemmatimonadales bacterium]NIR03310.1 hypothetical protein [Gemmatimonadales bacterium]NIS66990.1 hypothetical protein [Gemmatimonadales bacterium]